MLLTNLLCMTRMLGIVIFCPPSFGLVNYGIAPVHFLVPLWTMGTYWLSLARNASMLSLNGALPFYNTILAYVLHELSKAQCTMLLIYCVPVCVLYSLLPYITYIRTRPRWVKLFRMTQFISQSNRGWSALCDVRLTRGFTSDRCLGFRFLVAGHAVRPSHVVWPI